MALAITAVMGIKGVLDGINNIQATENSHKLEMLKENNGHEARKEKLKNVHTETMAGIFADVAKHRHTNEGTLRVETMKIQADVMKHHTSIEANREATYLNHQANMATKGHIIPSIKFKPKPMIGFNVMQPTKRRLQKACYIDYASDEDGQSDNEKDNGEGQDKFRSGPMAMFGKLGELGGFD